jgi:polysaccharide pyruvyl transferase WcaK-like protein
MTRSQPRPTRLGFYGVLGAGSIGNDGSLDALIGYLREHHPDTAFDFLVMGPAKLRARYHAPATHLQWYEDNAGRFAMVPDIVLKVIGRALDPTRTLRWVHRQDVVVVAGMGVLEGTIPMRPWGFPFGLLALAAACRATRTPMIMASVGADVIGSRTIRWMITRSANWADYRSYRDATSRDAMGRMGVDVTDDAVYPDLAYRHPVPSWQPDDTGTVGLGLMDYHGTNDERQVSATLHTNYVAQMKRFARWLIDNGHPIRFFTCDPVDRGVIDDVIADLHAHRPDAADTMIIDDRAADLGDLMQQMAGVDAVIATRYHNVVSAVQMAVPTVSIGYSRKHEDLMRRVGLGQYCQEARSVDADQLITQFNALESNRDQLVATVREHNRQDVAAVERQLTELAAVMFSRTNVRDRSNRSYAGVTHPRT